MRTALFLRTNGHRASAHRLPRALAALIGASLCFAAVAAPAKPGRDAAYCKRAGDWAAQEFDLRVRDRKRTAQDAIAALKPDQLASKAFFANYASNVIYDESFEVYDRFVGEGDAQAAKKVLDFKRDSLREVAQELCLEPDEG
ncbi:hypothetical protein J5226_12305 [Lysobacter sp. K5869]|uniref:hypothetical protein n=1 Tax=Lysobacter sp. K5869 TaxID=2820808 RepID=UPI001C05F149|nr:hypothetical protein [Lysobacter sp. K5869]QWP79113.1 hypothetical protein J5226_12305 [Lysobacter sp. K5869]